MVGSRRPSKGRQASGQKFESRSAVPVGLEAADLQPPDPKKSIPKRASTWVIAAVLAGVTALITAVVTGAVGQVVDVPAMKDAVRPGDAIRVTSSEVITDSSRRRVRPGQTDIDPSLAESLARPDGVTNDQVQDQLRQGINFQHMRYKIILEGRRDEELRIVSVAPHIVKKADPPQGVLMNIPAQGSDGDMNVFLDLDPTPVVLRDAVYPSPQDPDVYYKPDPGGRFLESKTISLKDREQTVLNVYVSVTKAFFQFDFTITYILGGATYEQTADDNGQPFQITGARCGGLSPYTEVYSLQDDFSAVQDTNAAETTAGFCS